MKSLIGVVLCCASLAAAEGSKIERYDEIAGVTAPSPDAFTVQIKKGALATPGKLTLLGVDKVTVIHRVADFTKGSVTETTNTYAHVKSTIALVLEITADCPSGGGIAVPYITGLAQVPRAAKKTLSRDGKYKPIATATSGFTSCWSVSKKSSTETESFSVKGSGTLRFTWLIPALPCNFELTCADSNTVSVAVSKK